VLFFFGERKKKIGKKISGSKKKIGEEESLFTLLRPFNFSVGHGPASKDASSHLKTTKASTGGTCGTYGGSSRVCFIGRESRAARAPRSFDQTGKMPQLDS
jgi:hypothetical protein